MMSEVKQPDQKPGFPPKTRFLDKPDNMTISSLARRRRWRVLLLVSALTLALAVGVRWRWERQQAAKEPGPLVASGTLEAESVAISPAVGGRIVELTVQEGRQVQAGALLARLDSSVWLAQKAQGEAALISAQALLAQLEAGARPEKIAAARAALAQAIAERDGAYRTWQNALAQRANPQELNVQIAQARAELAVAEEEIVQKQALLAQCTSGRDQFHYPQREWHFLNFLTTAAQEDLAASVAKRDGAKQHLANLMDMRDRPLVQNAQVHAAQAAYQAAEANVLQKQAALSALETGPDAHELAVAHAQVALAEAHLRTLDVYLQRTNVIAPIGGVVSDLPSNVGELAGPSIPLVVLSNLDRIALQVYVSEVSLGRVYLGQEVRVQVDAFGGETFIGHVVFISDEAEFMPNSLQNQEERVKMVFAVKVHLENKEHRLKPGLPVDAEFME